MVRQTSVQSPAITSFFLPVAFTQSRTRSSSQELRPVRSIGTWSGCTAWISLIRSWRSAKAVVNNVGTPKILAPLASMTVLLTIVSLECDRTASSCRY